jgi:uncharacterized protein (TIGR02145 family)
LKTVTNIPRKSADAGKTLHLLSMLAMTLVLLSTCRVSGQVAMPDVVCIGATKHYWVNPTPGSTYTWKINGIIQPSTTNEIDITWNTPYTPAGSPYTLSVQEMSSAGCYGEVKSGLVYVNQFVPVSITVTPSQFPACDNLPVTFTANALNGGTSPAYNWRVNGSLVSSAGNAYTYQPATGDVVICNVTSNALCVTNNPASSQPITMQVNAAPVVAFVPCFDTVTTTNAKPYKLRGGLPLNGTYTGPGINAATGVFSPAIAGSGNIPVHYSFTNSVGCTGSAVKYIHNHSAPSFNCGSQWTDIRDNKDYPTIQIGIQCWLAANLNYGTRIQSSQVQIDNCISEKYCYNNDPANCTGQGALYQWDELMKYDDTPASQGICPPGWHVPVESEWTILFNFYMGKEHAGWYLKDLTNPGFHALPSGVLYQNNTWSFKDMATFFWSSTAASPVKIISHGMNIHDVSVSYYESLKANAFPVRCLKD